MPAGFLFDLDACTGCRACEIACSIENELPWGVSWRKVSTFNPRRRADLPVFHLSLACNHCADAPCIAQCPARAITRRPSAGGAVIIERERCIGCGYCSWACPYDAPVFDDTAGVMTKCTFCDHRQVEGLAPACVAGCPTGALFSGELDALPGRAQVDGFPVRDHGAAIRFLPLREGRASRPQDGGDARHVGPISIQLPPAKIRLRTEWPLLVFSLAAVMLVAWFTAHVVRGVWLPPLAFVVLAAAAATASTLHLGRKLRAWRALLNVRRSWLSREIATYSAFAMLGTAHLLVSPGSAVTAWLAVGVGFAALFCIDRVYDVAERQGLARLHSADATVSGALLASALVAPIGVTAAVLALILGLYLWRKVAALHQSAAVRPAWTVLRLALLLVPALLSVVEPAGWHAWALAALGAGVILDRCELYLELDVPSPRRELARLEAARSA